MDDIFRFQAPVYMDFQNKDAFNVMGDEFFNYYREDGEAPENVSESSENESYTNDDVPYQNRLRRSSSFNDIHKQRQNKNVKDTTESLNYLNLNENSQTTQLQRPISIETMQPSGYLSLAEQIRLFHSKTPDRFKSKPKPVQFAKYQPTHTTRPQSPQLTTKMRSRPVHMLTAEEREIKEMEEIKKHQFKAQEVNKKILEAPNREVPIEKKPNTNFVPFNLTEIKKKVVPPVEEFKFHANPLQKKMFETVIGVPEKQPIKSTVCKTPSFMKESCLRSKHLAINSTNGQLEYRDDAHHGIQIHKSPKPTQIKPFNVIKRAEDSQRRREQKIKQILQEEKKMREFHAKPAPKFLRQKSSKTNSSSSTTSSLDDENQTVVQNTFKARPATVLHKKPFVPVKQPRPLMEIQEFDLSLYQRVKNRKEFEQKIKEKEDNKQKMLQKQEEQKRLQEEEELNRLRQEAVIKANPIKKFKKFILKPSGVDVTSPHTPRFSSRLKK